MDNHWQRVINCVPDSDAVCSKLEKHFICQKGKERETSRQCYKNRLTARTRAVKVLKKNQNKTKFQGDLRSLQILCNYACFSASRLKHLSFFFKWEIPAQNLTLKYIILIKKILSLPTAPLRFWNIWHLWSKVMLTVSWKTLKHRAGIWATWNTFPGSIFPY